MTNEYRIALVHATTAAIAPAEAGLAAEFPEAKPWNILDDQLLPDAAAAGGLTEPLEERMRHLIRHAADNGAAAVLLTCSMYGPVAIDAHEKIPALAPDEAAFDAAVEGGYARVAVVASFEAAMTDSLDRFRVHARERGAAIEATGVCVPGAFGPAAAGDSGVVADEIVAALAGTDVDAILLAQYSLAPAAARIQEATGRPAISGPHSGAARLRALLTHTEKDSDR
ncbi:hypothetical protein [Pseudactinotalea terrae]|uniref:hypothetical protein n=1 Tax=Pseudactinotalea terrae TaxID=1743262 RepID=UPI0012E2EB62|nr:hypothetical protein [Pseudactinotalea terrae]